MNIVLTGFMATGKSVVGKLLSHRLGYAFFDTDDMIEKQTGHTIADLFAKGGESAFRDLEAQTVALVALMDKAVIATGGGVPLRKTNMDELERNGRVFLLTASPDTIVRRLDLGAVPRPLLAGTNPMDRVRELLKEREKAYARFHETIETDSLTDQQVADKIAERVLKGGG
ncbi:MAG: shikimate kinase [Elusimicrobia bacterium]|nr:shikimate kinase [Elusimicrobiota bacterium]